MPALTIDTPEFLVDPHRAHARLRASSAVHRVRPASGAELWLVTRHEEARAALTDARFSKDPARRRDTPGTMPYEVFLPLVNSDPPDHTRLRQLVSRAFTARRIARLRPRMQQLADELLDEMVRSRDVDLIASLAFPLSLLVICELLGLPIRDSASFRGVAARLLEVTGGPDAPMARSRRVAAVFARLIAQRRAALADGSAEARPGLLSDLIAARDEAGRLTEHELVSLSVLMLIAGHETTANLIGNGMLALLRHPDQLTLLRGSPTLLPAAVEELLRYDSPLSRATLRVAAEDVTIAATTIPRGDTVAVGIAAANRDPARFAAADGLDITRTDNPHLAFGHGIHFCLGASLARLQAQIAIGSVIRRFPDISLGCSSEQLQWVPTSLVRGLRALPVTLDSRPNGSGT